MVTKDAAKSKEGWLAIPPSEISVGSDRYHTEKVTASRSPQVLARHTLACSSSRYRVRETIIAGHARDARDSNNAAAIGYDSKNHRCYRDPIRHIIICDSVHITWIARNALLRDRGAASWLCHQIFRILIASAVSFSRDIWNVDLQTEDTTYRPPSS
jgi:hypothetical protein